MKKARNADKDIDVSSDVKGYKQAVNSLSASISACVGTDLLSEAEDVAVTARKLEGTMKVKLAARIANADEMLRQVISTAETTRAWAPLAAHLDTLVADEVLRESCSDAVESAKDLLATLRAEEKERRAVLKVCKLLCDCFV